MFVVKSISAARRNGSMLLRTTETPCAAISHMDDFNLHRREVKRNINGHYADQKYMTIRSVCVLMRCVALDMMRCVVYYTRSVIVRAQLLGCISFVMMALISVSVAQARVSRHGEPARRSDAGVAIGWSAEGPLQACAEAKQKANVDRCTYLALNKTVDACKCAANDGGFRCSVRYRSQCRKLYPFVTAYAQTGTAYASSTVSRSMACRAAKIHARDYVCRSDRMEQKIGKCVCDADRSGWDCMVDFTLWCQ